MAVSIRASQGFISNPSKGTVTIPWPSGTVAGDLAVAEIDESRPAPPGTGWLTVGNGNVFAKIVTAADLAAGSFSVKTSLYGLVVFAGASKTGRTSFQNGVKVDAGGALFTIGWSHPYDPVSEMGTPAGQIGSIVKDYTNTWSSLAVRTGQPAGYVQSTADPPHSFSAEIVASASPPAPLLSAPAAGQQMDRTQQILLVWSHQGPGQQEAYRVSIRPVGSGTWQYLTSAGTLSGTLQTVTSSQQTATIAASTLTAGQAYEWQAATQEQGLWSGYSATRQFVPENPPTVSSVTPSFPAERLTGTVSWSAAASAGSLVAWQVAVTPSADTAPVSPMWSSAVNTGTSSTAGIPVLDWVNGSSYKAWVRVQQSGGLWSAWTSGTFTVSWTAPAAPSEVTATDGRPMTVLVGGVPAGMDVEAQWSLGDGIWLPLGKLVAPGTTATFRHPLAPYGVPVTFRSRNLNIVDGVGLNSAWTTSSPITGLDLGSYFVADDGAWISVEVLNDGPVTPVQGVQVSYGMGAEQALIDRGPVQGHTGTIAIDVLNRTVRTALEDWITTREVWTHRPHPELDPDSGSVRTVPLQRMSAASKVSAARHVQAPIEDRIVTFDWVER